MNTRKHLRDLSRIADSYGFYLDRQKKHYIWKNEAGNVVACAKTTSCQRSYKNFERNLRIYTQNQYRNLK